MDFGACSVNGDTIIICGGRKTANNATSACEILKVDDLRQWHYLPSMKKKRWGLSVVSIRDK